MELVLFLRIHAVVIKTRFTDSDDFRIRRDDAPDFLQILLRRFIGHVRMDTGRAKSRVMADKLIDQTVLPGLRPSQDTADTVRRRIGNDFFRFGKRPGK